MMGQCEAGCTRGTRHRGRVLNSAVPPPDFIGVFLGRELGIMDDKISTAQKFTVLPVTAGNLSLARCKLRIEGLMIRGIDQNRAIDFDPEAEGQRRMIHIVRLDLYVVDPKAPFEQLMKVNVGRHLIQANRKIRILHLSRQGVFDRLAKSSWGVDLPFASRLEEWRKKRNALNMVPVGVTDQDMTVLDRPASSFQGLAQGMKTASAVEDQERI
jgi:hypothetical protein